MRKSQILWGFFAASALAACVLAASGVFTFFWVFPLDAGGLPLWMLVCGIDVALVLSGFSFVPRGRLLLWCGGLTLFTARQGVPEVGIALVGLSAFLWALAKGGGRLLPVVAGLAVVLFLFGHDARLLNSSMVERLLSFRFSLQLISAFFLFRMLSWSIAVGARGERPGFLLTMEYFIAPAFWLSPLHAAHLVFDHMQPAGSRARPRIESCGWIARGFLHALLFSGVAAVAVPRLQDRYGGGLSSFLWWEWFALGPLLFLLSYLEKSRVSYIVAGLLSLTGRDITPDFRAPWLARSLPDYWRRFHFWLWEYYIDFIYMPLSALLGEHLGPRAAALLALFLTFSVGTSLIHWVHYPAPFSAAFLLGTLFGALTVAHGIGARFLERSRAGVPLTWASVFFLYAVAYPVYGLGWGLSELVVFFTK